SNYVWTLAATSQGITNFSAGAFQINRSALSNSLGAGRIYFGVTNAGNDLFLAFVPSNNPPSITVPPNQTINEFATLTVTNSAADPDPASTLAFRLVSPPGGMTIAPLSGVITWTPAESQGPGV